MQHRGSHVGRRFGVAALHRTTVAAVLAAVLASACGKKGPPLPPLVRVPEAVAVTGSRRSGTDVYITLRIPAKNIDGSTPVTVAAVEVVALTADRTPSRAMFFDRGTTVASVAVVLPSADAEGQPGAAPATPAVPSGPAPGDQVTVSETLTDEKFVPVALPATPAELPRPPAPTPAPATAPEPPPGGAPDAQAPAATAAAAPEIRRYYMAFTRDARKRPGPSATVASISLAPLPDAPADLRLTYTEQTMTVAWSAVSGATGYNVYADTSASESPSTALPGAAAPPPSLNGAPVEMTTYSEPVRFGEMSCYRVRAVRRAGTEVIEGPLSAAACERPRDSFPPAAPEDIRLLPASGSITVEWMANSEADLAGYLVLRGAAGDDTLQPIIDVPIREMQYVDSSTTPGVRYAYAVVAVDTAGNRSAASSREQATAR